MALPCPAGRLAEFHELIVLHKTPDVSKVTDM